MSKKHARATSGKQEGTEQRYQLWKTMKNTDANKVVFAIRGVPMDVQEFQRFYQEKVGLIYRYVFSKVGNREAAEDLTSGIFLKAVGALNQEFSPQSMQKWLFLIARTTVADYWRVHYRRPNISLD